MIRTLLAALLLAPGAALASSPTASVVSEPASTRLLVGLSTPAARGAPEDVARSYLLVHRAELGLQGQQLELVRVLRTKLGHVVRFQTSVNGLPLLGSDVTVALDPDNRIRRVASDARPVHGVELVRNLTGQQALNAAAVGVPMVHHRGTDALGEFREVLFLENGIARLGWEVHLATIDLTRNLFAVVDAATGEVKSTADRIYFSDAAKVYRSNPGTDGDAPLETVALKGLPETRDPDGHLKGELLEAYNCCTTENCAPDTGPKRIRTSSGQATIDSVICDMQHTASNVKDRVTGEPRTDYDYSAIGPMLIDPPSGKVGTHPGDTDTFAEVHVFHHAMRAYEFFRTHGAENFVLRDPARNPSKRTQVWANYLMQDYSTLQQSGSTYLINDFARVDNAAFMPREGWQGLGSAPAGTYPDSDALLLFQGSRADFGYDGDVIYHEFTHGVIYATARFESIKFDKQTLHDEGGAMHEGFADYFAAAITGDSKVGEYVGVRIPVNPDAPPAEGALRDLANDLACPGVIVGEVHTDSEHFSAALWSIRQKLGASNPHQFDAAVFDALASLTPISGFLDAARAVADSAASAFPGIADARQQALDEFKRRGVVECDKALPYTGNRPFYTVQGTNSGFGPAVPGPIQFKLKVPLGALSLRVSARVDSGQRRPSIRMLATIGRKITFDGPLNNLKPDAQYQTESTFENRLISASMPVDAKCGDEIYVVLANQGRSALTLADVAFNVVPGLGCPEVDAGVEPADEEPQPEPQEPGPTIEETGCGCSSASASPLLFVGLFAMLGLSRRRTAK